MPNFTFVNDDRKILYNGGVYDVSEIALPQDVHAIQATYDPNTGEFSAEVEYKDSRENEVINDPGPYQYLVDEAVRLKQINDNLKTSLSYNKTLKQSVLKTKAREKIVQTLSVSDQLNLIASVLESLEIVQDGILADLGKTKSEVVAPSVVDTIQTAKSKWSEIKDILGKNEKIKKDIDNAGTMSELNSIDITL